MAKMLRSAGYRQPITVAARLQREGMSPHELAFRLRTGQQFQDNPISGVDVLYVLAGVAVVGTIGYLIWKSMQDSAAAAQATAAAAQAPQAVSDYLSSAPVLFSAANMVQAPPPPPALPGGVPLPVAPS
jgi:hypothetical protein